MADKTPLYNLKAVIHEVGLSPATLRAWERRYGLLKPQRTPGGHRLYSRQDIEMLKWLIERQKEGLSIRSAVEMWKRQPENHQELSKQIQAPAPVSGRGEPMIDELREAWLAACMVFDDPAANQTLEQALAISSPETVCTEVLQRGLAKMGERWYAGSASVQQEHFASAIAIRRVQTLLTATTTSTPKRSGRILAACPPGEEHDFILLMITYLLRRQDWEVVYLGSNVPLKDLNATIQATTTRLIITAAQTLTSAVTLRSMADYITSLGLSIAYGGGIFASVPSITQCISGYYLGTDVVSIPQRIEQLLSTSLPMPSAQPAADQYIRVLTRFKENEALIVSSVTSAMRAEGFEPIYLEVANANLTLDIASALELGDIHFLDYQASWLNGLLQNRGISTSWVRQYYTAYNKAVERYLGQDGVIIEDWLAAHHPASQQ